MEGAVITPIGKGSDGILRVRVEQREVKNGIVFGKKTGFVEATTLEGYNAVQAGLKDGSLQAELTNKIGNGLYEVQLMEATAE